MLTGGEFWGYIGHRATFVLDQVDLDIRLRAYASAYSGMSGKSPAETYSEWTGKDWTTGEKAPKAAGQGQAAFALRLMKQAQANR